MGVSVGSSIYNAPSIYESGAGGGTEGEGEYGAGSVAMPEGFTRLLYIENNKIDRYFTCDFYNLNLTCDDDFLFSMKLPEFVLGGDLFFPIGGLQTITLSLSKRSFIGGKTYIESPSRFFGYSFEKNTNMDLSNSLTDVVINKSGLSINDVNIMNFNGPFDQNTRQEIIFPNNMPSDNIAASFQCFKFVVKNGNSIKYDFIPAKNNNTNAVGFLDLVNGSFYNASSSIAGPIIPY